MPQSFSLSALRAQVFEPQTEGWSESVSISFNEEIDGYLIDKETGEKKEAKVKHLSVFIGDVIKALATNASVAAFLAAKSRDDKKKLIPVLLAGAKVDFNRTHDDKEHEWITDNIVITISDAMLARIEKSLDSLFGL